MAKTIPIDVSKIREVLSYDPDTGVFTWLIRPCVNIPVGSIAGGKTSDGYWQIRVFGRMYKAHRLAYSYVHGIDPGVCVDHIDGDKQNNRIANLRAVTYQINAQNRKSAKKGAASRHLGVFYRRISGKWASSIMAGGKRIELGHFRTEEDARDAYLRAKRQLHEGCTL